MTAPADAAFSLAGPELGPAEFRAISALVTERAGIQLPPGKEGLVRSRLARRLRALGLTDFKVYVERVTTGGDTAELTQLLDAISTNKTSWWREEAHFDLLAAEVAALPPRKQPYTVWSAGCSSGEEPYTLGIVLSEVLGGPDKARILATDLSTKVLEKAKAGTYAADELDGVSPARRQQWFQPRGGAFTVVPALRRMVSFAHLNLMGPWPMQGPFDAIFCRNVMIYFDKPTQGRLVERYRALLRPGGLLCIGHSESLTGLAHGYQYVAPAVYRK
ncbi:MAG: protein-glutamate O-methyltransferase [Gemmatimonadaceae bacterium]|nr:protein-glutamate O-methyltransferase [Gemmatimonadaceae bacterium]